MGENAVTDQASRVGHRGTSGVKVRRIDGMGSSDTQIENHRPTELLSGTAAAHLCNSLNFKKLTFTSRVHAKREPDYKLAVYERKNEGVSAKDAFRIETHNVMVIVSDRREFSQENLESDTPCCRRGTVGMKLPMECCDQALASAF